MQTFSTIPQVSFLFYWWFPLPCRSLLVSCSSTCLFCLCFWNQISPSLQKKKKKLLRAISRGFIALFTSIFWFQVFYSQIFFTRNLFFFFELVFVYDRPVSLFCMRCPIFLKPFTEKTILSSLYILYQLYSWKFFFSCWIENFQLYWDSVSGDNGFIYFEG